MLTEAAGRTLKLRQRDNPRDYPRDCLGYCYTLRGAKVRSFIAALSVVSHGPYCHARLDAVFLYCKQQLSFALKIVRVL